MLLHNRRYRLVSNSAAILAAATLLLTQSWLPQTNSQASAGTANLSIPSVVEQTQAATPTGLTFSDLLIDFGLLLFLNR
ncbi:MAG: hypothetical protein PF630_09290 [Gammaproteobacteria bacterium]|jgi:hypothetical protein|nr:hypothetical protein [Gammaproteobacteria bacterium]